MYYYSFIDLSFVSIEYTGSRVMWLYGVCVKIYERNFPMMCRTTTDPTKEREAMRTVVGPIWSPGESSV